MNLTYIRGLVCKKCFVLSFLIGIYTSMPSPAVWGQQQEDKQDFQVSSNYSFVMKVQRERHSRLQVDGNLGCKGVYGSGQWPTVPLPLMNLKNNNKLLLLLLLNMKIKKQNNSWWDFCQRKRRRINPRRNCESFKQNM